MVTIILLLHRKVAMTQISENMSPLSFGTFEVSRNNKSCGNQISTKCGPGECYTGNVTNDEYCTIDCAQELSSEDRNMCMSSCMDMMESC
jgi:spore coat protein U-like protein